MVMKETSKIKEKERERGREERQEEWRGSQGAIRGQCRYTDGINSFVSARDEEDRPTARNAEERHGMTWAGLSACRASRNERSGLQLRTHGQCL